MYPHINKKWKVSQPSFEIVQLIYPFENVKSRQPALQSGQPYQP